MRIGVPVVSGVFAVLFVALVCNLVPGVGFAWLDEAIFLGYMFGGQKALAPVIGLLPLMVVGTAAAAFSWRWALRARPKVAFFRGVVAGLALYLVAVCVTLPFLGTFHGQFDGDIPELARNLLSSRGWISLVESLIGHLIFGAVLGAFYALLAKPSPVQVEIEEDPVTL